MNEIDHFFKAFYAKMKQFYLEFEADEHGLTEKNYWEIVLKKSEIRDEDFESIEQQLGVTLPASFKDFYKSHYSLEKDFDTGGLFIAGNIEQSKLSSLKDYIYHHGLSFKIRDLGLIPFGLYNDEWYVCLDMNKDPEDPSIVLFEMSNWEVGKDAISHRKWFSNFNSLLKCIADYLINGHPDNFNELDSGNNYLSAYDYWKK